MLKVGNVIKCHDAADVIDTLNNLREEGVEAEFLREVDGIVGFYLEVTNIEVKKEGSDLAAVLADIGAEEEE